MAATIKIKNSSTAGAAPTSSDLVQGELAVNVTDKRLFTENSGGTVVELGTNPSSITLPDGSASAPTLLHSGDTNTGLFFPAADTIAWTTGGTERARVDSSGNLGLGVTPSAWNSSYKAQEIGAVGNSLIGFGTSDFALSSGAYYSSSGWKYSATNSLGASFYEQYTGQHIWYTKAATSHTAGDAITFTQAMTLDASGNLGIGTTSPSQKLSVVAGSGSSAYVEVQSTGFTSVLFGQNNAGDAYVYNGYAGNLRLFTGGTERARIDSSGNLLVGTTSVIASAVLTVVSSAANNISYLRNSNASPYGVRVNYSVATPNNTDNWFFYADDATANRFQVRSNGGVVNYQANNVNLSDRREKTNFAPAKSYLDVICAIPVQTFNYIDQNLEEDDGLTLGVVAQDVQAVAPELVMESNWAKEGDEPKMRLSIYQTDLQYALMKSIQELKAIVDAQAAEIAALKG